MGTQAKGPEIAAIFNLLKIMGNKTLGNFHFLAQFVINEQNRLGPVQ